MLGYLKALFDWATKVLAPLFQGLFESVRRWKWFFAAIVLALLTPLKGILDFVKTLTGGIVASTESVAALVAELNLGSASSLWGVLADGAALMNCVVPLDQLLSVFGVLLSLWLVIFGIKAAVWFYRLIPGKFT